MIFVYKIKRFFRKPIFFELINNWFLLAISVMLFVITIDYYLYGILLIFFLFYLYKQNRHFFFISITIILILLLQYLLLQRNGFFFDGVVTGKVINIQSYDEYQYITIRQGLKKILIYDSGLSNVEVGMIIQVRGTIREIANARIPYSFDYKIYLDHQHVAYSIYSQAIVIEKQGFSIYSLNNFINNYFEKLFSDNSLIFLKAFILGDTSGFSDDFHQVLTSNGIIHLFAISGLHVTLFIKMLNSILKIMRIPEKYHIKIICVILGFYLIITKFSVSILRAILMYYLAIANKRLHIKLSPLDIVSIVFILMLIYNIYYIYNIGFVLSFFMTFMIILYSPTIREFSNIKQTLLISLMSMLFSFPIVINLNYEINILSPFINVIAIFLVSTIILPFTFIICFLPFMQFAYEILINIFIKLMTILNSISEGLGFIISFPHINELVILLYYFLLYFVIKAFYLGNKKFKIYISCLLISFLIIISYSGQWHFGYKVVFLDLYNGDSTLITTPNTTILVDTGDGSAFAVTKYLQAEGIKKIDYLILTHNHVDHNGEAENIINNFKVKNIVLSYFDNSNFKYYSQTIQIGIDETISTRDYDIRFLHPDKRYENENDNSLVFYLNLQGITYLFTGDASTLVEKNFLNIKADILKIGHHGSKTSTSNDFIKSIKPKYAIIMNGRVKKFDFPDEEVMEILLNNNVIVYDTKTYYTIIIKNKRNQCIITTTR